jgi:hypothetical protein
MRFGLFGGARTEIGEQASDSQIYSDYVDYICEAEALGFTACFWSSTTSPGSGRFRRR